jgi:hypothetical protein
MPFLGWFKQWSERSQALAKYHPTIAGTMALVIVVFIR